MTASCMLRVAVAALLPVACGGDPSPAADAGAAPADPFVAGPIAHLAAPPRAIALVPRTSGADVAAVLELQDAIVVLEPGGQGELAAASTLATGSGPRFVAYLTGARSDAIVTADTSGSTLTRFDVVAGGVDAMGTQVAVGSSPVHLTPAELDASEGAELVVTLGLGTDGGRIEVRESSELALLAPTVDVDSVSATCAGDVTGDGAIDVVGLDWPHDEVLVLAGDGSGALAASPALAVCDEPSACAVADVDADGHADVVLACAGGAQILFGPGPGDRSIVLPAPGRLYDVVAADLDEDASVDVAAVDVLEHAAYVWLAPGTTGLVAASSHTIARGPVALRAGDVDGDGDVDLAVAGYEERGVQLLLNGTR